jgi:hypothetical protein
MTRVRSILFAFAFILLVGVPFGAFAATVTYTAPTIYPSTPPCAPNDNWGFDFGFGATCYYGFGGVSWMVMNLWNSQYSLWSEFEGSLTASNTYAAVTYSGNAYDANGNTIANGSDVPVNSTITFTFDTPPDSNIAITDPFLEYQGVTAAGHWAATLGAPISCNASDADFTENSTLYDVHGNALPVTSYINFPIAYPTLSITPSSGLSCGALSGNSVTCTVTQTGALSATMNFATTTGEFFVSYKYQSGSPSGCFGSTDPSTFDFDTSTGICGPQGCTGGEGSTNLSTLKFWVHPETLSFNFTGIQSQNNAPTAPSLTCPGSVYVGDDVTVTLQSTDQDGDKIRYGVDWLNDSPHDVNSGWSAYKVSGTSVTRTKTGGYATAGTYPIYGIAEDKKGADSSWAGPCTVTVNDKVDETPSASLSATDKNDHSDGNGNATIEEGDPAYLVYQCDNSDSAKITNDKTDDVYTVDPNGGTKEVDGLTVDESPITYTLECDNSQNGESDTDTATVTVEQKIALQPYCYLYPASQQIDYGDAATLWWNSTNATSCWSDNNDFNKLIKGAISGDPVSVYPNKDTTYDLICANNEGTLCATAYSPVSVSIAEDCSISAAPSPVIKGDNSTITWNMTNNKATCSETGPGGFNFGSLSGSQAWPIDSRSVFWMSCTLGSESCIASTTVNIAPEYKEI